jgi:spore coat polysaccharide biosynthesis protein SpsF (cytidylyltransferase family)
MRVVLVVQARMGSTRFPGKVMAPLRGRPMLDHVLARARRARCLDQVVLATTDHPLDDALLPVAEKHSVVVVRGSEDDVLSRFVTAAAVTAADIVVRVTADCPLLDPRLVDRVTRALVRTGADYASNVSPPSYPDGYDVEALSVAALRRISVMAVLPYQREHVTATAREDHVAFRHAAIHCRRDLSAVRLTVDVPADLQRVAAVLTEAGSDEPGLGAVLAALARRPDLATTNGSIARDERYHAQRIAASGGSEQ